MTPSHRTAIRRTRLSRPCRMAVEAGLITPATSVLDYGCGRGDDVRRLARLGVPVAGYDPHFAPGEPASADVVLLTYVLNVIECPDERAAALRSAWALARRCLVVAVRGDGPPPHYTPRGDGHFSARGTFQKFFPRGAARRLLAGTLGAEPARLGRGVYLVDRPAPSNIRIFDPTPPSRSLPQPCPS